MNSFDVNDFWLAERCNINNNNCANFCVHGCVVYLSRFIGDQTFVSKLIRTNVRAKTED